MVVIITVNIIENLELSFYLAHKTKKHISLSSDKYDKHSQVREAESILGRPQGGGGGWMCRAMRCLKCAETQCQDGAQQWREGGACRLHTFICVLKQHFYI